MGGVGFLHYDEDATTVSTLIELWTRAAGASGIESALNVLLLAQSLGSLGQSVAEQLGEASARNPATVERIRAELLAPGRGMLVYLSAPEASHVFALDQQTLRHVLLPPDGELGAARRTLLEKLRRSPRGMNGSELERSRLAIEEAAADAAQLFLPAAIRELTQGWSELFVTGLDTLGYLPVECLPSNDGEPLGMRMAVTYLPSAQLGCLLRARMSEDGVPGHGAIDVQGVIASMPAAAASERWRLSPIPWSDADEEQLFGGYAPDRRIVLAGEKASKQALLNPGVSPAPHPARAVPRSV